MFKEMFKSLRDELKKAGINKTYEEYYKQAITYSIIAAVLTFPTLLLILYSISKNIILSIFPSIFFTLLIFFLILFIFYSYPLIKKQDRERKIDNALPMVLLYISIIASSGAHPIAMFKFLAENKSFGEISKEAKKIVEYTEILGVDLPRALELAAKTSPSKNWKDILLGIRTILVEGGNLPMFLYQKVEGLIQEYKRKVMEYVRTLSLFMEMYIALVIVGSIFALIMTTLMGVIAGMSTQVVLMIQTFLLTVGLPMVSIMFILLIKAISPFET